MERKNESAKQIRSQYNAASRFAHPAIVKILNTTNSKNKEYFLLHDKLKKLKKKPEVKIYGSVVSFPNDTKTVIIDNIEYKISSIEKQAFNVKHIVKRYTLKYKLWLTIQYLKKPF